MSEERSASLQKAIEALFPGLLGVRFVSAAKSASWPR